MPPEHILRVERDVVPSGRRTLSTHVWNRRLVRHLSGAPTAAVGQMLAALSHRGPDDQGIVVVPDRRGAAPPAIFAHARLAILDLSPAGHQPMADRPGGEGQAPNQIVFNGEIFNFLELHGDLARAGWPCRTRCDTEAILHSYRVWGEACVERMRGMFAWCLLDEGRGTAWFCRDRLGIKPLYLYRPDGGGLLFASELRALLAAGPDLVPPGSIPPHSNASWRRGRSGAASAWSGGSPCSDRASRS